MNDSLDLKSVLDAVGAILIRSFILGIVFLVVWFLFMVLVGDLAYTIHSIWFDMSKQQFDLLWYGGMGLAKMFLFFCLLIPYIGIKMVLANK